MAYAEPVRIVYGNIGISSENTEILSGSKTNGEYDFTVSFLNKGLFLVSFVTPFSTTPAVVLTQINHGSDLTHTEASDWDTNPQFPVTGSWHNCVLVGISISEFKLITGGSTMPPGTSFPEFSKSDQMFSFTAVGFQEDAAPIE